MTPDSRLAIDIDNIGGKTDLVSIRCITQDEDGRIWFGTDTRLMSYDGYDVQTFPSEMGNFATNCLQIVGKNIYIGTNEGLVIYDRIDNSFVYHPNFSHCTVRALSVFKDLLCVGTDRGLQILDLADGKLLSSLYPKLLSDIDIYSLHENRGMLHIGSVNSLYTLDLESRKALEYPLTDSKSRRNTISESVYADDSIVLSGTQRALTRISASSLPEELGRYNVVKTIIRDDQGNFLIGTDNGLFMYSIVSGESFQLLNDVVSCSFLDGDRNIWLGTDNGLRLYKQDKMFRSLVLPDEAESATFTSALRDSRGRLWLSSNKGIILQDDEKGDIWFRMGDKDHPLFHNRIKDIIEMPDHRIMASSDVGYLVFDEKSRQMTRHTVGGMHNWLYDMESHGDTLWISGYEGILRVEDDKLTGHFTFSDDLSGNDISNIEISSEGNVVALARNQKVFYLQHGTSVFAQLELPFFNTPIADVILMDSLDRLWIASGNQAVCIDKDGAIHPVDMGGHISFEFVDMEEVEGTILAVTTSGLALIGPDFKSSFFISPENYLKIYYDKSSRSIYMLSRGIVDKVELKDAIRLFHKPLKMPIVTGMVANGEYKVTYSELVTGNITLDRDMNNLVISLSDFDYSDNLPQHFLYRLDNKKGDWLPVTSGNQIILPSLSYGKHKLYVTAVGQSGFERLDFKIRRPWYLSWFMILIYLTGASVLLFFLVRSRYLVRTMKMEKSIRDAALSQAKEKEDFFVTVAHELKTPLSLVIAPLGKLISDTKDENTLKTLRMAQENALRLNTMVHETIGVYSDTADIAGCVTLVDVDFPELLQSMMSSYIESYQNLEFIVDCQPSNMILSMDLTKIESVINNLVSNACKYTPDGGTVIVTAIYSRETQLLELSVSDTGIGIPKNELPFIFHKFYESSRTKGGGYDSTGVGLSIIKNYVDALKGTVTADSDENGTTFKLVIPCRDAVPEVDKNHAALKEDDDRPLIVIVEDNLQICSFLESSLSPLYRCISVHNGKSGLKLCKDVYPDLIISDIFMPVMDGMEMCREIRKFTPLSIVPIILLTAKANKDTELESLNISIDAFVPKPFDIQILMLKINQLLAKRSTIESKVRIEMASKVDVSGELSQDEKFLRKITKLIEDHIDDSSLTVPALCNMGNLPEKQVYRKIKQLTGMSTVEYIRSIRLKKAALLLQKGSFTVAEVMYNVGFSSMSYFSRAFTAEYGMAPSAYMKSKTESAS